MQDPLKQAEEFRAEADRLLAETRPLEVLGGYGSAYAAGSHLCDLMTWRDIDLCLVVRDLRPETVLDLAKRVSVLPRVGSMYFRNELVMRTEGNPRAIFLCADLCPPGGAQWKVDVLVSDAKEVECDLRPGRAPLERLTPETREAILRVKSAVSGRAGYRREFGGRQVCEAVLDHGVRTEEVWNRWFAGEGP